MSKIIYVETRTSYGRTNTYVVSEHASFISALTGKKTVDSSDADALRSLGFEVKVKPIEATDF